MKAAYRTKYGPFHTLKIVELDRPVPKADEILVRIHATTVNRTDCGIVSGKPFPIRFFSGLIKPKFAIPGTDFAGSIVELGNAVQSFSVGDRVWGLWTDGIPTQAQYACISTKYPILKIADHFSFEQAAASGEAAFYAYNFINKIGLEKGQKLMVNGATGGIGSATVQLAKHFGLQVWATCAGPYTERIKELGADIVIDYTQEDFSMLNEKFDYVMDAVGKSTFSKCRPILKKGGVYVSSELGPYAQNIFYALITPLFYHQKVIFPLPSNTADSIAFIQKLIENKEFKPLIDKTYPLSRIAEAYDYVASGQKIGNVIISYNEWD
jgi:NADPH:quinone reductase-like Zn-dependent oxidoreductase